MTKSGLEASYSVENEYIGAPHPQAVHMQFTYTSEEGGNHSLSSNVN